MALKKGTCKLCFRYDELINNSHIIPEWIYKNFGFYDEKHSFAVYNPLGKQFKQSVKSKEFIGYNEGDLFCLKCEARLKVYEDYAKSVFVNANFSLMGITVINGNFLGGWERLKYKEFRIFFLSLFWRFSISKQSFFDTVKLQPEIEERLRKMILNDNPGNENEFPFSIYQLHAPSSQGKDMLSNPRFHKDMDHVQVLIGLWLIQFFLKPSEKYFTQILSIKNDGVQPIVMLNQSQTNVVMGRYYDDISSIL